MENYVNFAFDYLGILFIEEDKACWFLCWVTK